MRALIGKKPMFYQSIKHRKTPAARVFYIISLVFSNDHRVLSLFTGDAIFLKTSKC